MCLLPGGIKYLWKGKEEVGNSTREGTRSLEATGKRCFTVHYVKVLPTGNILCLTLKQKNWRPSPWLGV